jgi:hypothetical protein
VQSFHHDNTSTPLSLQNQLQAFGSTAAYLLIRNDSRRTLVLWIRAPKRIEYASGVVGLTLSTDYRWVGGLVGGKLGVGKEGSVVIESGTLNQS